MRSFRQFFNEIAQGIQNPFAGGTQYSGYFDLPDLRNFVSPGERQPGGYQNFAQLTQAGVNQTHYQDKDIYFIRETLEKIKALVENVYSAIELRSKQSQHGSMPASRAYEKDYVNAYYDANNQIMRGISKHEVIGGNYPRLRNEEMARAEEIGVMFPDPSNPAEFWAVSVPKLRQEMETLQQKLRGMARRGALYVHAAGKVDQAIDTSMQARGVQRFH